MAKKKWHLDEDTGLPVGTIRRLHDRLQTLGGKIDPAKFPRCDLFDVKSIAAAAGYRNVSQFREKVRDDETFAREWLYDSEERPLGFATNTASACWWGARARAASQANSRANLRRGAGSPVSFELAVVEVKSTTANAKK